MYVNFPKISNGSNENNVGSHVRELWGVVAPKTPQLQNSNMSDLGEIWTIYVNLHEKNNEIDENSLGDHLWGPGGAAAPIKNFAWL